MRTLILAIVFAASSHLTIHRDVSSLPAAIRASLPADFDPAKEALAGDVRDGGTAMVVPSPTPLPTDGGSGTIVLYQDVPVCRGQVVGPVRSPKSAGVLYRVPRNIQSVRLRMKPREAAACPVEAEPRNEPNCVCQGIALSSEQVARGLHICSDCRAP